MVTFSKVQTDIEHGLLFLHLGFSTYLIPHPLGPEGRGSDIFHKKRGVGKIGGCFKKGGITYFYTNPFLVLAFSECVVRVCVCCLFTPFPSVLFVSHWKNIVL